MMQTNNEGLRYYAQEIFRNIEKTGEVLKQELKALSDVAQKRLDSQVQRSKFEAAYVLTVPKEQRKKTMEDVKNVRNDLWAQALDKAGGDSIKAYAFYRELCDFP